MLGQTSFVKNGNGNVDVEKKQKQEFHLKNPSTFHRGSKLRHLIEAESN